MRTHFMLIKCAVDLGGMLGAKWHRLAPRMTPVLFTAVLIVNKP